MYGLCSILYFIRLSSITLDVTDVAYVSGHVYYGSSEAPEIRNMVKEVNVLLNQDIVLNCDVHGFPKPSVTWLREGVPIATGMQTLTINTS